MQRSSVTVTFNFDELLAFQHFCLEIARHPEKTPAESIAEATHVVRVAFTDNEDPHWQIDPGDLEEVLAFAAECFGAA